MKRRIVSTSATRQRRRSREPRTARRASRPRALRRKNAIPSGTAVSASPKLWIRSARSATDPDRAKMKSRRTAAAARTVSAIDTVFTPSRERRIERSIRPCEWPCALDTHRRSRGSPRGSTSPSRTCSTWKTAWSSRSRDMRIVQRVDDAPAAPLADDETEMPKHPQLVRHRRALHLDRPRQLVHGAGAVAKPREDPDPARRRERLHRLRNLPSRHGVDDPRAAVPPTPWPIAR